MSVASDKLRELVDITYPAIVDNLNKVLVELDKAKVELDEQIQAVEDGVLLESKTNHLNELESIRITNGWDEVKTWGNYGVENLTQWAIISYSGDTPTGTGSDQFTVPGDRTSFYTSGKVLLIEDNGGGRIYDKTVLNSVYTTLTTVNLNTAGKSINNPMVSVDEVMYSLTVNWDNNPVLINAQDDFDIAYNHLHQEPSVSGGTYGLIPKKDQVQDGIDVQTINRDKYVELINVYEPYAT